MSEIIDNEILLAKIKDVSKSIGNGKTKEALKILQGVVDQIKNKEYNDLITLLNGRFNDIQKQQIQLGEDTDISIYKLNRDIVNFTSVIEEYLDPVAQKKANVTISESLHFNKKSSLLTAFGVLFLIMGWGLVILSKTTILSTHTGTLLIAGMISQIFGLVLCLFFIFIER